MERTLSQPVCPPDIRRTPRGYWRFKNDCRYLWSWKANSSSKRRFGPGRCFSTCYKYINFVLLTLARSNGHWPLSPQARWRLQWSVLLTARQSAFRKLLIPPPAKDPCAKPALVTFPGVKPPTATLSRHAPLQKSNSMVSSSWPKNLWNQLAAVAGVRSPRKSSTSTQMTNGAVLSIETEWLAIYSRVLSRILPCLYHPDSTPTRIIKCSSSNPDTYTWTTYNAFVYFL